MKADRYITPLAWLLMTVAIVTLPASRSPELGGVISFLTGFATLVAIFAILALGLNVQWGYTGIFNFGVVAFFMVGAYTAGIITKSPAETEFVRYVGGFGDKLDFIPILDSEQWLPFLFGTAGAAIMAGALAFLLSIPTLRLREDYLAIATIGIAELLRRVTIEEKGLVNSDRGLIGIPVPMAKVVDPPEYKFVFFGLVVVLVLVIFLALEQGIRSPWGRVLKAIREDEIAASAAGKDIFAFKMQSFVVGAMIMGVGGAAYAYYSRSISPDAFTHFFGTFLIWAMLIVGGSGNNKGAILGAYMVWGFYSVTGLMRAYFHDWGVEILELRMSFIRDFVVGVLIVTVLLLRPAGLLPEERRVSLFVRGEDREPAAVSQANSASSRSPPD
ncbi:MAG: branched-chain amino acid ABC transporter permease [Dehalococcoidia bacterium]